MGEDMICIVTIVHESCEHQGQGIYGIQNPDVPKWSKGDTKGIEGF